MLDAMRAFAPVALERSRVLERLGLAPGDYLVATLHRAENTPARAPRPTARGARRASARAARPVVLPLHPRTAHVMRDAGLALPRAAGLRAIEPLGYLDMIALVARARIVLTDSGGLQKEAFFLGRPCVTLRDETEWVETVTGGGNVIAGTDPASDPRSRRGLGRGARARRAGLRRGRAPGLRRRRGVREDRRASPAVPGGPQPRLSGRRPAAAECAPGHVRRAKLGVRACDIMRT